MVRSVFLELRNITFAYKKDNLVLDDLNVKFYNGSITALLGINGSGKTTLFKILTGIYKPENGFIFYNNMLINYKNIIYYKSQLGFMPEFLHLYKNMYLVDVLRLLGSLKGYDNFNINGVLDTVYLSDHANKKVKALSKGMKQRLNLGQAIIGDPKIILFDEPSNGFDCGSITMFYNILKKLAYKGSIVLLSSHHLTEIYGNVDKVVILSDGIVVKELDINFFNNHFNYVCKNVWIITYGIIPCKLLCILSNYGIDVSLKGKYNILFGKIYNDVFIDIMLKIIKHGIKIKDIRIEDKILEDTLLGLQ